MKNYLRGILVSLLSLYYIGALADNVRYLVLTQHDGSVSSFALNESPVIKTTGNQLTITTSQEKITVAMTEVKNYSFSVEAPSSLEQIGSDRVQHFAAGEASFSQLQAGSNVLVLSADGKVICDIKASDTGTAHINLNQLGKGIFIIRTSNGSYTIHL